MRRRICFFALLVVSAELALADNNVRYQVMLQPGPDTSQDIWTTSIYSYAPGGSVPGGGLADARLRVGGWGDFYYSLLQFDLSSMPKYATSATLSLYDYSSEGGSSTGMVMNYNTQPWNWTVMGTGRDHGRLWWADLPSSAPYSTPPQPSPGSWCNIDITGLYNQWQSGTLPNYGVQLRPTQNSNNWNGFYSSRYSGDPTLRPKLTITATLQTVQTTQAPATAQTTTYKPTTNDLLVFNASSGTFTSGSIDLTKPVVVLTHGFSSNVVNTWVDNSFAATLHQAEPNVNIVAWNWAADADQNNLGYAASRVANQGVALGQTLATLLVPFPVDPLRVHDAAHAAFFRCC